MRGWWDTLEGGSVERDHCSSVGGGARTLGFNPSVQGKKDAAGRGKRQRGEPFEAANKDIHSLKKRGREKKIDLTVAVQKEKPVIPGESGTKRSFRKPQKKKKGGGKREKRKGGEKGEGGIEPLQEENRQGRGKKKRRWEGRK